MSAKPSPKQKSVNGITRLVNLTSASLAMLHEPPRLPKKAPPPELFLAESSYALRLDDEITQFSDLADLTYRLEQLPEREIDIVLAGRTALDLSFQIPNGPFTDLEAMIESELEFRSPIPREQCVWFWSAQESPAGDWTVEAAIVLKSAVNWVLDAMRATGKSINLARRHTPDGSLRIAVTPDWLDRRSRFVVRDGVLGKLGRIPPTLRMPMAAFVVFLFSALSLFVLQSLQAGRLAAQADAADAVLAERAAVQAATRGLLERRNMGNARLAVIGSVAAALPDGIWLEQMIVDGEDVTIIGFAPSAAEVTRLLSALPGLTGIEFGSPVTRDNTQNLERFRINAVLTGQL